MHRQNLKLLLQKVYEEMRLQENTLFDLDLGVKVTQNVTQYLEITRPMHRQNLKLLLRKVYEEMRLKKIHSLTFDLDLGVKVTRNITQYPLHHVIYASAKFEIATSNG